MTSLLRASALAALLAAPAAFAADAPAKPACPTNQAFEAGSCECPKGYGLVLNGKGGGECQRKACQVGAAIKEPASCDCPTGYDKKKGKKGTQCVASKPAPAKKKAAAKAG
jgi:hypothetical protein